MEVAEKGVTVHMVCPGPVDTPYFKRQFGPVLGKVGTRPAVLTLNGYYCRDLKLRGIQGRRTVLD